MDNFFKSASGATFSPDRKYRYALWRQWIQSQPYALFIGLNPSTANEHDDDPTIRRCKRFARDWGYGALCMANLFALRATAPKDMLSGESPIGTDNDRWLRDLAKSAGIIVCAWGTNGSHLGRDEYVRNLLADYELKCLGVTKHGHPRHPLYVKASQKLVSFGHLNAS